MTTYYEVWTFWYEAQQNEQDYNRKHYSSGKPTLRPASHFDPAEDAEVLRKAMKGLGTNEKDITRILTRRTLNQRTKIQEKYQQIHGRDLVKDLEKELSGIFEKVILSLMKPLPLFFAEQLKNATKGLGTDEGALIEIICTRDDNSLKTIQETFEKEYHKSVEEIVCKETGGQFEKLLMSVLSFCRDDSASSPSAVADELANDDIKEDDIRRIVTSYTFRFLKKVFEEYQDKTGEEFEKLVDKKCKGDSKKAFKAIYLISKNRIEYYAHALNEAMKGRGTDDWALIRIIVSRCEIDLGTIKDKYAELYEKDLIEQVKKELSGDYEKALVNLLGGDE
ncbi:Annexin B9 [Armadillidium nasatum]|uniref:Annexin n=1 Tax=Armadillidium nasatum TaxID=96803 RepID=A0A5N5T499_9CRUS|nr:Annexin B9 [Armadillidium nasatum]